MARRVASRRATDAARKVVGFVRQPAARRAADHGLALPPAYWRMARGWFWLGVPAFSAMVLVVVLMVGKRLPGVGS